jgi:hypothetical protein
MTLAIKKAVGALGPAILSTLVLGLLACSSPIHEEITQGTYDGFRIGSSGEEVYQRVQQKYQTRKFESFFMYTNSSSSEHGSQSGYNGEYSLEEAKKRYGLWNQWQPRTKDRAFVTLTFNDGVLAQVSGYPHNGWNPQTISTNWVVLPYGISQDSVYVELEKLAISDTAFAGLTLRLFGKDLNAPYDSAMLEQTRYWSMGVTFDSANYDRIVWTLIYPGGGENALALEFMEKKLYRIIRDYDKYGSL